MAEGQASGHVAPPGSGDAGSGRIDRGVRLTKGTIRILLHNKKLLWFSFFSGLAILFSYFVTFALQMFTGNDPFTGIPAVPAADLFIPWIVLYFSGVLVSQFLIVFILVGLISCVSMILHRGETTVREGFSNARLHARSVIGYVVLIAAVQTGGSAVSTLFPGLLSTIAGFGILFVLALATIFVVPVLVFEKVNLTGAIRESFSLLAKTWAELVVSIVLIFIGLLAVMVVATVPMAAVGFSGDPMLFFAAYAIFFGALTVLSIVGSTLGGILLLGLYTYGKTARLVGIFGRSGGISDPHSEIQG